MTRARLGGLAAAAAFVLAMLAFSSAASASGGQNPGASAPNPLVGQTWWDQNTQWNPTWNGYRSLLRRGDPPDQGVFRRQHHERRAKQRVRSRREDTDRIGGCARRRGIDGEPYIGADAPTDPFPLHLLDALGPVDRLHVGQQAVGVVGDP